MVVPAVIITHNGHHALLHAERDHEHEQSRTPVRIKLNRIMKHARITRVLMVAGHNGPCVQQHAAVVFNNDERAIHALVMTTYKNGLAMKIQADMDNGQSGQHAVYHAAVPPQPDNVFTAAQVKLTLNHRTATHIHVHIMARGPTGRLALVRVELDQ